MKPLTHKECLKFSAFAGARKTAIYNFLCSYHHCGNFVNAYLNLDLDARLYRWDKNTVAAITAGLKYAESNQSYE